MKHKESVDEYIRKRDAIDMCGGYIELAYAMAGIEPVDVVSKADLMTLLEQTEKDLVKDTDKHSVAYNFIVSVIGIIKCKIMQMNDERGKEER